MELTIERIVERTPRGMVRDFAVAMILKLAERDAARSARRVSSDPSPEREPSRPYPMGILFSPEAAEPVMGRLSRLGYGFLEAGPLRAGREENLAEVARQYRVRLEAKLRRLSERPRLSIRLALPPVLEHHGFIADVVLAYRRIYPIADQIVIDALDALVRPWSPEPHRFVLEPLMAALQEWNRHYVLKPLLLRIPVPVGGHVRALLADLETRRLVSGVVLASGWRQIPVPLSAFIEAITVVRRSVGREIPITVEAPEEIAGAVCAAVSGEVTGLVDPFAGLDKSGTTEFAPAPDRSLPAEGRSESSRG